MPASPVGHTPVFFGRCSRWEGRYLPNCPPPPAQQSPSQGTGSSLGLPPRAPSVSAFSSVVSSWAPPSGQQTLLTCGHCLCVAHTAHPRRPSGFSAHVVLSPGDWDISSLAASPSSQGGASTELPGPRSPPCQAPGPPRSREVGQGLLPAHFWAQSLLLSRGRGPTGCPQCHLT